MTERPRPWGTWLFASLSLLLAALHIWRGTDDSGISSTTATMAVTTIAAPQSQSSEDAEALQRAIELFGASAAARYESSPTSSIPSGEAVFERLSELMHAGEIGFHPLGRRRSGSFGNDEGHDVRVHEAHRSAVVTTSLVLVHEAVHSLLRDEVHPMESEVTAWMFELRFYRSLRNDGLLADAGMNDRHRQTLRALEWLDKWPRNEQGERRAITDYLLTVLGYERHLDMDWILPNWDVISTLSPPGKAKVVRRLLAVVNCMCGLHIEAAIALLDIDPGIAPFWVSPPSWQLGVRQLTHHLDRKTLHGHDRATLRRVKLRWKAKLSSATLY